jgi:hypothetical protein
MSATTELGTESAAERHLKSAVRNMALAKGPVQKLQALKDGARALAIPARHGFIERTDVRDELLEHALTFQELSELPEVVLLTAIESGLDDIEQSNGHHAAFDPPPPDGPEDYGSRNNTDSEADASTAPIVAKPYEFRDPASISRRQWLYAKHYVRGFVSTTLARPGQGKTERAIAECLSMTTGRPLLGPPPADVLRCWYLGEDPFDEIERRMAAACAHHQIDAGQIGGRLFINSTLDLPPLKFAETKGRGVVVNHDVFQRFAGEIERLGIDVLILDPLIKFHGVPEGDNSSMEVVMRTLSELASRTRIAIEVPHHIRKQAPGMTGAATVDDGRGASAIIAGVRTARLLNPMSAAEADKAGITEADRWRYVRVDHAKASMAPPEAASWMQHASEILPCGESVGVAATWKFPDAFANVTGADVTEIRALARTGAYRSDERAKDWFGSAVASHLGLDLNQKADRAKVKVMLKTWTRNKVLDIETRYDPDQRKDRDYFVPGPWSDGAKGTSSDALLQ